MRLRLHTKTFKAPCYVTIRRLAIRNVVLGLSEWKSISVVSEAGNSMIAG